ncbi:hypothetical protein RHSIM_Rhsim13G0075800 [Rhododendron simsii]|uniref:Copper transport protein n=1 Tax=Rhododendron simsii TaxID=118357 RepID=A0A834FXY8_RHOSS|nr:hypothetical protein RHSIM_Rhsim13G0075800 [Rhododendron simsii]
MMHQKMMNSHMTFIWGKNGKESLISYLIDLISVFLLSLLVECLSHTRFINAVTNDVVAGLMQTVMYGVRIGLAYLVMLLVMSCNVGILLAAVAGFSAGFLVVRGLGVRSRGLTICPNSNYMDHWGYRD